MSAKAKIGVLGASGYTGAELVRLLLRHPHAEIVLLTADRRAGKPMSDVFPQFAPFDLPTADFDRERRIGQIGSGSTRFLRAAARHDAESDQGSARQGAGNQGRRPLGGFPPVRSGRLCALVWARAFRAGTAEGGGVRADRGLSLGREKGAARRQSRLLHDLLRTAADPAAQGQGDRSGRDRHRRQIRHDRRGQGGQGRDAVLGSVRRLSCLWRRPSSPHGRARPGILQGNRPRGGR